MQRVKRRENARIREAQKKQKQLQTNKALKVNNRQLRAQNLQSEIIQDVESIQAEKQEITEIIRGKELE